MLYILIYTSKSKYLSLSGFVCCFHKQNTPQKVKMSEKCVVSGNNFKKFQKAFSVGKSAVWFQ